MVLWNQKWQIQSQRISYEDAPPPQHVSYTGMSLFLPIVIMSSNQREISQLNALITTDTQLSLLLFQVRHYEDMQKEYKEHKYCTFT